MRKLALLEGGRQEQAHVVPCASGKFRSSSAAGIYGVHISAIRVEESAAFRPNFRIRVKEEFGVRVAVVAIRP
jgi:hypothetical protein